MMWWSVNESPWGEGRMNDGVVVGGRLSLGEGRLIDDVVSC